MTTCQYTRLGNQKCHKPKPANEGQTDVDGHTDDDSLANGDAD